MRFQSICRTLGRGLIAGTLACSTVAFAESSGNSIQTADNYLGAEMGAGVLSSGGGSHLGFGITAGRRLTPDWGVGAFFNYIGRGGLTTAETGGLSADASLTFYGLEGNYFVNALPGAAVGAKAAIGHNSVTVNGTNASSNDFYYGPKISYDYTLTQGFTLGGEANMLFTTATDGKTTSNILATLKYWI